MSYPPPSILLLGISPSLLNYMNNRLRGQGVDVTPLTVTNSTWSDAEIARMVTSKNWNGLIIGDGVRQDRGWYERLVQVIHNANPNIQLIQHHGPNDAENAIERHFNVRLPLAMS